MKKLLTMALIFMSISLANAQYFTNMPPLNREQSKILEKGILGYVQAYPDSIDANIYLKLKSVREFISSPINVTPGDSVAVFTNIQMKIVDQIERTEFGGSVINWRIDKDSNFYMLESQQKMINDSRKVLKIRKEFQCKYFTLLGMPCPN